MGKAEDSGLYGGPGKPGKHSVPKMVVVVVSAMGYLAVTTWNLYTLFTTHDFLVMIGEAEPANGSVQSDLYVWREISLRPVRTINVMWLLLYAWNLTWVLYSLVLLFKKEQIGYLYCTPDGGVIHIGTYFCFMLGLACLRLYMEPWNNHHRPTMTAFLFGCGLCMVGALLFCGRGVILVADKLEALNLDAHLWSLRVFAENGLGIFHAWALGASTLYEFNKTLVLDAEVDKDMATTVGIILFAFVFFLYAICDLGPFGKYNVYTISPYCVWLWLLGAMLHRNWKYGDRNCIMLAVLITLVASTIITKFGRIVFGFMRYCFEYKRFRRSKRERIISKESSL